MKSLSISSIRADGDRTPRLDRYGATDMSRPAAYQIALRQLGCLQAQACRLAAAIEAAAGDDAAGAEGFRACTETLVRTIQQARLDRTRFFPPQLFADPAWDMLLELNAAQLAELEFSVADLCIASNGPATTALECLTALEQQGLVERRPDSVDERRFSLALSDRATRAFTDYFATMPKSTFAL
jgi:hypothetical protein